MRGKRRLAWLVLAVLLLLCGCSSKKEQETGYTVYYVNETGTQLTEESYKPSAETFEEMMDELLGQLRVPPAGKQSALPESVKISGYERGIDALRIDMTQDFYSLDNIQKVLLQAAVVKTVSQIPGVAKIMFTVNSQQIVDDHGELIPAMDAESFIDTKEGGINSYQYATLTLYFGDGSGDGLQQETRNVHYSSNMMLERVVVEQLIRGTEEKGLLPVLSDTAKILNVNTKDGVCTINLDGEFDKAPASGNVDARTALYAVVNSICATCDGISGVKFEINGQKDVLFRGEMELGELYVPDQTLLETEDGSGTEGMSQQETQTETQKETQTESAGNGGTVAGVSM